MHFTLPRLQTSDAGTFGQLLDDQHRLVCVTLEPPWRDNAPDVSCIPAGEYPAHRVLSPKRGIEVFMLDGVPGRDAIELHIGNTIRDTEGCILLGMRFGDVNGTPGILDSHIAFVAFMNRLAGETNCLLTILDVPQSPSLLSR